MFSEVGGGLRFIYRHPVLRPLASSAAAFNFFSQLQLTLFVLYANRDMHMSAAAIGLVLAFFGIGGVAASVTVRRALAWLGYGSMLLAGYALGALAILGHPAGARAGRAQHGTVHRRVLRGRIRHRRDEHRDRRRCARSPPPDLCRAG